MNGPSPESRETTTVKDWPDNDEELLAFGPKRLAENYWSLGDAFEGLQIFGGTGSGKSSGSGHAVARAMLEANLGGLVLTAKPDEVLNWKTYAKETGREPDLLIVEENSAHRFNFLRYELQRPGVGAGHTENLVNLFCAVMESAEKRQGGSGAQDSYWQRTLKQLLRSAIDLAVLATNDVDLPGLYRIITSAPRSPTEADDGKWQSTSVCHTLIEHARQPAIDAGKETDWELTRNYWLLEFPALAPETRSVIVSSFTSMADCFLRGMLRKLFCTDLNFSPEDSFSGKIIILNLPVKEYNELGQFAQVLFKFVWQRAVERRIPPGTSREKAEQTIRPVFLWADESQFFASSYDAMFQSTARSSRACTVYLTQNLPSYHAAFSGHNARSEVDAFLGNLQTKIFHANGDSTTNNWAANTLGRTKQIRLSGGLSEAVNGKGQPGNLNQSASGSQVFEYLVQPQEFTTLRTGGRESGFLVDSIIFQGGRRWLGSNSKKPVAQNYIRHSFNQIYG
ncbi:AAA-like domain-containing protein [Prosthecobacter debontii]|uniref:AAA-like domain-containing protein n=1 Tax=Prosthecobacter debontii TaxID=48467 RepID=A0A1T4YJC4_9BACT|nr:type IV secretory system conjugative DNA transfer family protein [Prosthecobacter debontii]SKB01846.1 AAA-like domain-containing protein [Prosthecobacter debontii]